MDLYLGLNRLDREARRRALDWLHQKFDADTPMRSGSEPWAMGTSGLLALLCIGTVLVYGGVAAAIIWWFLR